MKLANVCFEFDALLIQHVVSSLKLFTVYWNIGKQVEIVLSNPTKFVSEKEEI